MMSAEDSAVAQAGRRRLLYGSVAAAAVLAGAGVAAWKWRSDRPSGSADQLWALSFETPAGSQLAFSSLRGRPLLLNFWATWCPPCIDELPMLDAFFRESSPGGWQVVGLAIDQPSAVRGFLQRTPLSFPVGLAGFGGSELSKNLGNLAGGLPFTVVIGSSGQILQRKIGRVTAAELAQWKLLR